MPEATTYIHLNVQVSNRVPVVQFTQKNNKQYKLFLYVGLVLVFFTL